MYMMKNTLVLFVFHELNDRVNNFIKNAIFVSDDTDFLIVSNGGGSSTKILTSNNTVTIDDGSLRITLPPYVKFLSRPNIGHDFGAWSDGLLINDLYRNYQNFIFVNSSIDGPFNKESSWTQTLLNGLSSTVKLFGCTINTCGKPNEHAHVQSYAFAMDKEALEYLIQCEIFSNTKYISNKQQVIEMKEIGMSRKIIERGWNIGSLLKCYEGTDWTVPYPIGKPFFDDLMYPRFENIYWKKEELVFIKGNR